MRRRFSGALIAALLLAGPGWADGTAVYVGTYVWHGSIGPVSIPSEFVRTNNNRLVLAASWELDFWGKYRRGVEAARGELLASESGRDAVRNTLIADVARGYFALRAAS